MELGEAVSPPDYESDDKHDENVCPWHEKKESKAVEMDPQDGDEDAAGFMPNNSGKKLGTNMVKAGMAEPRGMVPIYYKQGQVLRYPAGKKEASVQIYEETADKFLYPLQFAPHHLIPGNESLKGSRVVPFLGDDAVIKNFKGTEASLIKTGFSVGYDVNTGANGVWLPSPYALSMSNEWPAIPGIEAIRRRKGEDIARQTEEFRMAYAVAAIDMSKAQFHMRHFNYSRNVRKILDAIGSKLELLAGFLCPVAGDTAKEDKFEPPAGLVSRLNALSGRLRGLLTGSEAVWRPPLFTDALSKQYAEEYLQPHKGKAPSLRVL